MYQIVLCRHGQSVWNKENRFTGWWDVELSEQGIAEAKKAGALVQKHGLEFDMAYTSVLKRAIKTLWHIMEESDQMWIPVERSWRLNERHYGGLTGLNKKETAQKHGDEQVHIWRRSYDTPPPSLEVGDEYDLSGDRRYKDLAQVPNTECLKDTLERVLPFWHESIVPQIKANKKIVISAHGNSLRAIMKHLGNISDAEITQLEIPTGSPILYQLDENCKGVEYQYLD